MPTLPNGYRGRGLGGRRVACRWRIRHKLILGLGLVVGILALLLAGTYKGLESYRATTSSIGSKLVELSKAQELKEKLKISETADPHEAWSCFRLAQEKLDEYEEALNDTIQHHRDPDNGEHQLGLVEDLRRIFRELHQAIEQTKQARVFHEGTTPGVVEDPLVKPVYQNLLRTTDDLHGAIYTSLFQRITQGKSDYKASLIIVLATGILGVLLMSSLLQFFYRWTFYPIRDLQQGVGRVAQGDFDYTIEVKSGDELEELATAFNDMTTRLRDMYRDLARQVNERSRQLVRSERLAGIGFLAAGVAHEINNPLASIAFCSEALEGRLDELWERVEKPTAPLAAPRLALHTTAEPEVEKEREVITKYLRMIQQEAFRCKEITQRLLEFSRGGEKRREPTDLAELVQSVIDVAQHLQNSKGKRIVFAGRDGSLPPHLRASVNAQELKSVVLNLVVNALDSMDEGGKVTIELRQCDRMAELVFADTGCGMTAEVLENIFEPFFTRSRTGKGTGLGLSISHRIVNQHGGEIEAASPGPNQGSTFTVRIPLEPAETEQQSLAA